MVKLGLLQLRPLLGRFVLLSAGIVPILSAQTQPFNCITNAGVPLLVRTNANAELLGDMILVCDGTGYPGFYNFQIFFNAPFTSNTVDLSTGETEALLLINEPAPAPAVNNANGFS